jgi:hypothetical protein
MARIMFLVAVETRALCDLKDTLCVISTNDDRIAPL